MNTEDGKIHPKLTDEELVKLKQLNKNIVEMKLPPTQRQLATGYVGLYDPCPCGSGSKFKFCCYTGQKKQLLSPDIVSDKQMAILILALLHKLGGEVKLTMVDLAMVQKWYQRMEAEVADDGNSMVFTLVKK